MYSWAGYDNVSVVDQFKPPYGDVSRVSCGMIVHLNSNHCTSFLHASASICLLAGCHTSTHIWTNQYICPLTKPCICVCLCILKLLWFSQNGHQAIRAHGASGFTEEVQASDSQAKGIFMAIHLHCSTYPPQIFALSIQNIGYIVLATFAIKCTWSILSNQRFLSSLIYLLTFRKETCIQIP